MDDLELTILGSSSAIPISNRSPTSQFLTISNRHFLIDCGEGTQVKLRKNNIGFGRINHILISHLHGDHFYGLVPLLTSLHLLDRHKEMHIYGPAILEETINCILGFTGSKLRFPVIYHHTSNKEKKLLYEDKALTVHSFPVKHSMPTCGFLFEEKERPRNIRKEKLEEYSIPVAEIRRIKEGADWTDENGKLVSNHELSSDPPKPLTYAFCTDTAPLPDLDKFFTDVDLLYHEATFMDEHEKRARQTRHTTAKQAAAIAQQVRARHLLLGHFSVRYLDLNGLLNEGRSVFENSHLALEDHTFTLKRDSDVLHFKR